MYEEIGSKIKVLGKVLGWLMLIAGIITWLILICNYETYGYGYHKNTEYITHDDIFGWLALIAGGLSYVSSWFIVGFGQLIEDTENIAYAMQQIKIIKKENEASEEKTEA